MIRVLKNAPRTIWIFAREIFSGAPIFQRALILFAGIGLAAQLATISGYLYQSSDSQAIVAATDNDAGVAVSVAINTQLYDDNGWRPYGPVYYRLVRIARTLVGLDPAPPSADRTAVQLLERQYHFLLMFISALSLMLLAYFIASLLTPDTFYQLLMTIGLTGAFLSNPLRTEMIFRAHPDHLFALTVAFAIWRSWLWLRETESRRLLIYAGCAWGLAAATKMTVLMFAFGVLCMFWPFDRKRTPVQVGLFVASGLFIYLLVGFPQNFNFGGVIKFLLEQKRNVVWGDIEFLGNWLSLFAEQVWRPAIVILAFSLFVPLREDKTPTTNSAYVKLTLLILIPVLTLWSRRVLSSYTWYALPFLAAFFVALTIALTQLATPLWKRLRESNWTRVAAFFLVPFFQPALSSELPKQVASEARCRNEARAVERILNSEAAKSAHILVDPYIPYARAFHERPVEMAWEMKPERIQKGKTSMIALVHHYYAMYLPLEEGGNGTIVLHIRDLPKVREFYGFFNTLPGHAEKRVTTDHLGQTWKKTHSDTCGYEVWQR